MRILSVDSTAQTAAVGIVENQKISALYSIEAKTHSTTLLPMIESVLDSLGLKITDMDLLAVSNGPGSFTGIRIGIATIKGLAFKNGIPCIGVSSLEAMAYNLTEIEGIICPVINARRNQVYSALFQSSGGTITRLTDDSILLIHDLDELLVDYDCAVYFVGDAAEDVFRTVNHPKKILPPTLLRHPNAFGVAMTAEKQYHAAENTSEFTKENFTEENLSPSYLRKSQPEREREEREKKSFHETKKQSEF